MEGNRTIVLVNPPSDVWVRGMRRLRPILNTLPQIGIASLTAVTTREGLETAVIDAHALGMTHDELVAWILSRRPAIVGLTGYTSSVESAARVAALVKEAIPGVVTVVGGPHVTALPEQTMAALPAFDYGLIGEAERSAPPLFRAILEGDDPGLVPGVARRDGGAITVNERAALIDDLDTLPFPAFELLPGFPRAYRPPVLHSPKGRAITLVTSRGCPYRCTFCDRALFGNRYRFHGVPYIVEMIRRYREAHGIDHFIFYDDNFTANRAHLTELCEAIARLPFRITFSCDARADHVDARMLALMKRAGAWMISYGIETANPELLKLLDKSLSLEQAARAIRLTSEAGIITKGLFMIGVPRETEQTIERTKEFIKELPFDLINLSKFTPYPGSAIYRDIARYGRFEKRWDKMSAMNFVFWPDTVAPGVLERESNTILIDFYRNSRRARRIILRTMNLRDAARLLSVLFLKVTGAARDLFRVGEREPG
jgi:anaerobic magnesium-protoporphyrin IX monomethyl ester cyclase